MAKKTLTEEQAEKNRKNAKAYYYKNIEKCRKYSKDQYYKIKESMKDDIEKRMQHSLKLSDRTSLYYSHRLLRELTMKDGYDEERMMYILRRQSITYMFDPETMRRHVEIMLIRRHRVPTENARKMAMIIRETVREYQNSNIAATG